MSRTIYIISPDAPVDAAAIAAADGAEIVRGIPPALAGIMGTYPFFYTEPDDPLTADRLRIRNYMPASGSATASAVSAYIADTSKDPAVRATMAALRSLIRLVRSDLT